MIRYLPLFFLSVFFLWSLAQSCGFFVCVVLINLTYCSFQYKLILSKLLKAVYIILFFWCCPSECIMNCCNTKIGFLHYFWLYHVDAIRRERRAIQWIPTSSHHKVRWWELGTHVLSPHAHLLNLRDVSLPISCDKLQLTLLILRLRANDQITEQQCCLWRPTLCAP